MILLTGGNGYIGTAISSILMQQGEKFRVMDNLSGSDPLNLLHLDHVDFFWGDIRKREDLKYAFEDIDAVIHLAAKLPATPGMLDEVKSEVEDVNYHGTLNVLEEARKRDAKVLFASTCNIYGIGTNLREEDSVKPLNPYSQSKLKAERACMDYHEKYGLNVKILRLASVYGYSPGVRFNLVVNYFVLRALLGYELTVFGDGENWRPFIHVKDAARSFLFLMENGKDGIYNVGGKNLRIRDVAEIVRNSVNPEINIEFIKEIKPEFSYSVNFDKISETGFKPEYDFRDGLLDLAERLKKLRSHRNNIG
jgi:UDP-glucose 4-epimerase